MDSVNIERKYAKFNGFPSKGSMVTFGAPYSLTSVQRKSAIFPFSGPWTNDDVVNFLSLILWSRILWWRYSRIWNPYFIYKGIISSITGTSSTIISLESCFFVMRNSWKVLQFWIPRCSFDLSGDIFLCSSCFTTTFSLSPSLMISTALLSSNLFSLSRTLAFALIFCQLLL